jgi:outer membrane protein assembly factor BamB
MYSHDPSHTNANLDERALGPGSVGALAQVFQAFVGANVVGSQSYFSNSTPSIASGIVYVGSPVPQGPNLLAFDANTGSPTWSANVGYAYDPVCSPYENTGVPSSPAVANGVVTVGGGDASYYGLDARSGSILWRAPLPGGPSAYSWASPLVLGSRVIWGDSSQCDNPSVRGLIQAADLATGAIVGQQFFAPPGGSGGGVWNSPAATPDGKTLVVASGEDNGDEYPYEQAFLVLDAGSLAILGADKEGPVGMDIDFASSPVVFHDASGRAMGGATIKSGIFYAYYLDSVSSGPAWTRSLGAVVGATPAYDSSLGSAGTLFVVGTAEGAAYTGGNALLYALDPATGKDVWASPALLGNVANNVAIANRLIFVNTGATGLNVLDETTGNQLRNLGPPNAGLALSGVAVAQGKVYWVSGAYLNAWGVPGS